MNLEFDVKVNIDPALLVDACSVAEKKLAIQVMKDTVPYVPALTGTFSNMTRVIGNQIVYTGVMARYLWEGKVMVDSETGKGARYLGEEIGYRHRRGATLVPTDRNLNYSKSMHPKATSHWFNASKAANMQKWLKIAKLLIRGNGK